MSSSLSLQQVLKIVAPTFQSVDVRCFSFCIDGSEYNTVTVVGFNEQAAEEVSSSLHALIKSQPVFGDNRLQFRFKVYPSERWHELVEEFKSGIMVLENGRVNLMRPVDLLGSMGYIDSINFLRRRVDWPVFESHLTWNGPQQDHSTPAGKLKWVQQDSDLLRHLNANGYRSLKDVFRVFINSRPDSEPSYASDVYIAVPIFAAIRQLRFSPTERRLHVDLDCHAHLQPGIRAFGEHTVMPRENERISFSMPDSVSGESCTASASLNLEDRTAVVNVMLSHKDLGYVTAHSAAPRELVPPEELNPLWHLVQAFCPSGTIESLLTAPPKPNDKRQKEQRYFEQHIAWLLALYGYSVIVLGEFECLRTPGSAVQHGSLDILAFHKARNKVLMCSCTLTPPEERDYGNLVSLRSHLLSRINKDVSFRTELAIFSSAAECVPPPQYRMQGTYVAIFDAPDLKKSIDELPEQRDNEFFEKLDGARGWPAGGLSLVEDFGYR